MVSIRSVSNTALDSVANDRPPTKVWYVKPDSVSKVVFLEVIMHVEEGYPRLN